MSAKIYNFPTKDGKIKQFDIDTSLTFIKQIDRLSPDGFPDCTFNQLSEIEYPKHTIRMIDEMKSGTAIYYDKYDEYKNFQLWYDNVLATVQTIMVVCSKTENIDCPNIDKIVCNHNSELGSIYSLNATEIKCYNLPKLDKVIAPNAVVYYCNTPLLKAENVHAKQVIEEVVR